MTRRWTILALMLLTRATSPVCAQVEEDPPFVDSITGVEPWRVAGSHVRFEAFGGQGIDFTDPYLNLGLFVPSFRADGVVFLDVQVSAQFTSTENQSNNLHASGNVGVGYRTPIGSPDNVLGASFWYDADGSREDMYNQLGLSLEGFFGDWDVRNNYYFPLDTESTIYYVSGFGDPFFRDYRLLVPRLQVGRAPLTGFDFEVGRRIENLLGTEFVGVYGGFYYYNSERVGGTVDGFTGLLARVEARISPNVTFQARLASDEVFSTTFNAGLSILLPGGPRPSSPGYDRMLQSMRRRQYVAVANTVDPLTEVATDAATGNPFHFIHVDSNAPAGGNGSFENPYNTLADAEAGSAAGDIVYAYSNSTFIDENFALKPNQRLLGEGVDHFINTEQIGITLIPEIYGGATPIITSPSHSASITLASNTEFSNFDVSDAQDVLITADGVSGDVNVNRTSVSGTGIGVSLTNSDADFTFTDMTITDPSETAFFMSGGTGSLDFFGAITQSNDALTVHIVDDMTDAMFAAAITATNGDGFLFDNADGMYLFSGTSVLDGTANAADTAIDILNGSDGTFTFVDASIVSPTGVAFNLQDSTASVSYAGSIVQDNAFTTIDVDNHSVGNVAFLGTIAATDGDGLQFDNADGSYVFSASTTLNGTANGADTALDILNGSEGSFSFADASIVSPTGVAFNLQNSTASVTYTGSIVQDNAFTTVDVDNHSGGTVTINGSMSASDGDGLQFNNADGTYNITAITTLDGTANAADTAIDIFGGSAGEFTFGNTSIVSPTGTAFDLVNSTASVNYTGSIVQDNPATTVNVDTHSGGTVTFNGTIDATDGDGLQFFDADGNYNFDATTTLNGGNAAVDIITSDGSFTFADTTIISPIGNAFFVSGGIASVDYTGAIVQDNDFSAVRVINHLGGTIEFNGTIDATNGDGLHFDTADGIYTFDATTVLDGTSNMADTGIDILDSAGTFTFADTSIVSPTGAMFPEGIPFYLSGGSANVTYNGSITQDNNFRTVLIEDHIAGTVTFSGTIDATDGVGLSFDQAGGTYIINSDVSLSGFLAVNGIQILDSPGTFEFNGTTSLTDDTDIAVNQSGNVTFANLVMDSDGNIDVFEAVLFRTLGGSVTAEFVDILDSEVDITLDQLSLATSSVTQDAALQLDGVSGAIDIASTTIVANADVDGILVENSPALTADFGETSITLDSTTFNTGLNAFLNADGLSLSFDTLDITNGLGRGIFAVDSHIESVGGGSIIVDGGVALQLSSLSVGAVNFDLIESTDSNIDGIRLNAVTGGSLTIQEATITDPQQSGVDVSLLSADLTFDTLNIYGANQVSGSHSPIFANNVDGSLTINGGEIKETVADSMDLIFLDDVANATIRNMDVHLENSAFLSGIRVYSDTFAESTVLFESNRFFVNGSPDFGFYLAALNDSTLNATLIGNELVTTSAGTYVVFAQSAHDTSTLRLNVKDNSSAITNGNFGSYWYVQSGMSTFDLAGDLGTGMTFLNSDNGNTLARNVPPLNVFPFGFFRIVPEASIPTPP